MQNSTSRAKGHPLTGVNNNSASGKQHFIPTLLHIYTRIPNIFFPMNNSEKNGNAQITQTH